MAPAVKVAVFVLKEGQIFKKVMHYDVPRDASASALVEMVSNTTREGQHAITLLKPNVHLSPQGFERLRELLDIHDGDLKAFCQVIPDEENPISGIVQAETTSNRSHHDARNTALIVDIEPTRPARRVSRNTVPQEVHRDDGIGELEKAFERVRLEKDRPTPSVSAQPPKYAQFQRGPTAIFDGRYTGSSLRMAIPIELYHPVFAAFLADAFDQNIQPPEDIICQTAKIMHVTSEIATAEQQQQRVTREFLVDILDHGIQQIVNSNKTSPDHFAPHACRMAPVSIAALAFFEEKPELGSGGEGSVQGSFSYLKYWADKPQERLTKSSFCPSFIVSIAGPWIVISGAIFTSRVIVQRLTDYLWLGHARMIDDEHTIRIARVFYALHNTLNRLRDYYDGQLPGPKARFFPLATSYFDEATRKEIEFQYLKPLKSADPSCTTFLAQTGEESLIVVKFVERYGREVHNLLASKGYAPKLLYCGDVWRTGPEQRGCGQRMMVVMEFVRGVALDAEKAASVLKPLEDVLDLMKQHNMVHGDLRMPNILIENESGDVKIIDFDWAGMENIARYPLHLSPDIAWPDGAADYSYIQSNHDIEMVGKLFK
ncbi:hypothetical protein QCA50_019780 [Cerrena zonata]|uniref:Protein kinase domain-containing protein n=1 Tax=Cerrena zonata TaxID=2478898 RepID=A0AAW0FD56_9APHY